MRLALEGGQLRVLSDDQVQDMHLAVLRVLKDVGVRIEHADALKLLKDAGSEVDLKERVAKIPEHLVEEAVRKSPKNVRFCGRDPKQDFIVRGGKGVYFGPCAGNPHIIDETGRRKRGELSDMEKVARISDALPNIDFVMGLTSASDVPPKALDLYEQFVVMSNTHKHAQVFVYKGGTEMTKAMIELAALIAGGEDELSSRPILSFYIEPQSPLLIGSEYIDALIECCKLRLPIIWAPCTISGGTAPISLAGNIIQGCAESIAGVIIGQLINPGTPFIVGTVPQVLEMKHGMTTYSSIEAMMMQTILAQLVHHYHLPSWGTAGVSDSKVLDEQATAEAAMSLTISALSGNNIIHDVGYLESAKGGSMALLAICDELIGMLRSFMRGVRIDEETLAVDAIKKAGHGGSFLSLKHTLDLFFAEHIASELMDRSSWHRWEECGSKTLAQRAHEKVQKVLKEHRVEPLPPDIREEASRILKRFER